MKKMIYGVLAAIVLLAVLAVVVSQLVPLETYKPRIVARVKDETGLDLRIGGAMRLSLLPRLEIDLDDVGLSNVPDGKAREMLTVEKLRLVLRVLPLLSGRVEVASFVLDQPKIRLETDEHGGSNWQVAGRQAKDRPASSTDSFIPELSLDDVRIADGSVQWSDARSGANEQLAAVDASLSLRSFDDPLEIEGQLVWHEKKVSIDFSLDRPRAWLDGGTSPAGLHAKSEAMNFRFKGNLASGSPPTLLGAVDVSVPSIRELMKWIGVHVAASGSVFGALAIQGDLTLAGPKLEFRKAKVEVDDIDATGDLRIDVSGERARLEGSLAVEHVAIDPYLSSDNPKGVWSEEPLPFERLTGVEGKLELSIGSVRSRGMTIGKTVAAVGLEGGKLAVDFREMALYGGNVTGKLTIATDGRAANVALALKAGGCQSEPLLRDASGYDRLSGAGDLTLSVTTRGASERDLVAGLDGKGAFQLRDGVLRGINLAGMVTHVATAFQAGAADKTEFSEVHGTFTLDAGVARNSDLVLKSPLMQIAGDGTVNLNARTMDYRISPKFVAPVVGQLGLGSPGVRVPVMIRGPWSQLRYEPDLAGLAMNVVDVPVDVLRGVIEIPGNLIGGKGDDEKKDDTRSRNPLRNLFGR